MTLLVVRLRLAMWRTAMRRSSLHLTSSVVGGVLALGIAGVFGPLIALLALQPPRVAAVTVPIFTGLTLMWLVLGIVATGVDNVLDPARFAILPVRAPDLARGLLAAALTGIPAVLLILLSVAQVLAWAGTPQALPAALVAAVLGVLTAILASRAVTALLARVMTTQVGRVVGAAVVAAVTLLPLFINLAVSRGRRVDDLLAFDARPIAEGASWFPVGWAWSLPLDVAEGRWGLAAVHGVLALGLVVVLWVVWVRQLERTLTSPLTSSGGQRIGRCRLLPLLLGRSPTATVTARRIRAWYRDSRLIGIALRTAVLPVFFIVQATIVGSPGLAGAGVVSIAIFAGLTLMNDLAFDGQAWWIHVATGLSGWEDRLGRVLASVVLFGPPVALTYLAALVLGLLDHPVPWLAVSVSAFLSALALAIGVGAFLPGTAPRVGGNPFSASSGGAAQGCLIAIISFVGPILLVVPVVGVAVLSAGTGWEWATVLLGTVYGLALVGYGVVRGGRRLDETAPEMLGRLAHAQM